MNTKRKEELMNQFLSTLDQDARTVYQEISTCLSELGYHPQKERSNLTFKCDMHHKQIAKKGIKNNQAHDPFFALRFSACSNYSLKFADVVRDAIEKSPSKTPRCPSDCNFCGGDADTHIYSFTFPDGARKSHCGAYALEIPNIAADDIQEIKNLIHQEHEYLLAHESHQVREE